ncbi:MAG: hypothetical protein P8Y68_04070 [Anaerolineales bacterium]
MKKIWEKLFKQRETAPPTSERATTQPVITPQQVSEAETAPLSEEQLNEIAAQGQRIEPLQLITGAARNVGKTRDQNEDSLFLHTSLIGAGTSSVPFGVFIVADGMGGHQNGEKASETAVRTMGSYLINKLFDSLYGTNPSPPSESLQEIMKVELLSVIKTSSNQRRVVGQP